jgi:CRP/FNR family cyclic AMP-dependent transcriptional regulator
MGGVRAVFVNARTQRSVVTGEVVFQEGDTGAEMFGVVDGAIELRHGDAVVGRVEAGGTFGELAIIDHAPRSLTAVAAEPTTLAVIDEQTFLFLVHETPMFALQVMRSLSERLRVAER